MLEARGVAVLVLLAAGCGEPAAGVAGSTQATSAVPTSLTSWRPSSAPTTPASSGGATPPSTPAREVQFALPADPLPSFVLTEGDATSVVNYYEPSQTVITVEMFVGASCAPFLDKSPEPQFPKMERTRLGALEALYVEGWAKTDSGKKGTASYVVCTSGGPAQITFMAMKREAVDEKDKATLLAVAKSLAVAPEPEPVPAEWVRYVDKQKQFSVSLPSQPDVLTDALGGTTAAVKVEGGALTARCFELDGNERARGEAWMGYRKGSYGDGALVRETQLLRPDGSGLELSAELTVPKPLELTVRILRRGKRACSFSALLPKGNKLGHQLRAFLDSASVAP